MKRFLAACAVLMLIASSAAFAGEKKENFPLPDNEISVSYGVLSAQSLLFTLAGALGTAFALGAVKPEIKPYGNFIVEYQHAANTLFSWGGTLYCEPYSLAFSQYAGKDEAGNSIYKPANAKPTYFVGLMPSCKTYWFNREHFGMYSHFGLGVMAAISSATTTTEEAEDGSVKEVYVPAKTQFIPAIQLGLLCADFGGEKVRGFLEVGVGTEGVLQAGVKYAF